MSLLNDYLNAYAEMIGSSTVTDNKRIKLDHATFSGIAKLGQGDGYDPFAHYGQLRE
jgi:hypothetical protein